MFLIAVNHSPIRKRRWCKPRIGQAVFSILLLGILTFFVNYIVVEQRSSEISEGTPIVQKEQKKEALSVPCGLGV